ncbi:hypothetical protein F7725_003072 [Dissostichus mawsoni]|uniref:Myosin light chain kinase n=1 Tax=Dissostichus mawsoni TaxID=36200 RepID=A0A7J5Y989_DISMA|nr:hypothetical protein F7725_003072 [Dissostichus mawsoni]
MVMAANSDMCQPSGCTSSSPVHRLHRNGPGTIDSRIADTCPDTGSVNLSARKRLDLPVFIEPLQDCCVDEGNDITLRGALTGGQPIQVSWLHNGEVARFGKPSFNGRETSFVVRECLPEDAGATRAWQRTVQGRLPVVLLCMSESRVSNIQTSASKSMVPNGRSPQSPKDEQQKTRGSICSSTAGSDKLSLVSSPREVIPKKRANSATGPALRFENPPQHLEVKVGQTARLTCSFTGSPPVVSCWIRNKDQIVDGPELWSENTDQSSTLVIAEANPQHTGRYTVVVKDRKSSAQHTVALSVIEPPQPPASCPVISLVSPSSLVLSWSGPCYDGGSAVLGYVVEVKNQGRVDPGDWAELTAQCKSTSYKVCSGLLPQQEYCFKVRAYNAVGVSEPGPVSPVVRMDQNDIPQEEETPQAYSCVTVDSSHKVTDHYSLQEKLGMGKFGLVFKLTHKETGRVCAGKFYKGRRAKEREAARKEIELMNFLHHPQLVQCLAAYDHKPEMVMVMEFIAGGELFERIVDDSFVHTELASVRYMQQILEGIAFMHQQNIVHLDMKPENIVWDTPLKVMHGTPEFVAPEVINYEPVCLFTDMWSIGVICYILLSGESPFQGNNDVETLSLEALAHPWMAFDSGAVATTKSLSKEKMKRFLARQKWKKAGKALLALKRMALLSKGDSSVSPTSPGEDLPLSPEAEHALQSLERKMQVPPQFTQSLEDLTVVQGSCARLSCHLTGYPDPEVVWLCGKEHVEESPSKQIEYDEDGRCTLVLDKVGPEESGVYTCRATNDQGEAFCSAKLILYIQYKTSHFNFTCAGAVHMKKLRSSKTYFSVFCNFASRSVTFSAMFATFSPTAPKF